MISFRFEGFGFYEINEMHEVKGEKKRVPCAFHHKQKSKGTSFEGC